MSAPDLAAAAAAVDVAQSVVDRAIARAVDALVLFARGDLKRAMNEFNREEEAAGSPES